jgi:hypothetical protein
MGKTRNRVWVMMDHDANLFPGRVCLRRNQAAAGLGAQERERERSNVSRHRVASLAAVQRDHQSRSGSRHHSGSAYRSPLSRSRAVQRGRLPACLSVCLSVCLRLDSDFRGCGSACSRARVDPPNLISTRGRVRVRARVHSISPNRLNFLHQNLSYRRDKVANSVWSVDPHHHTTTEDPYAHEDAQGSGNRQAPGAQAQSSF